MELPPVPSRAMKVRLVTEPVSSGLAVLTQWQIRLRRRSQQRPCRKRPGPGGCSRHCSISCLQPLLLLLLLLPLAVATLPVPPRLCKQEMKMRRQTPLQQNTMPRQKKLRLLNQRWQRGGNASVTGQSGKRRRRATKSLLLEMSPWNRPLLPPPSFPWPLPLALLQALADRHGGASL